MLISRKWLSQYMDLSDISDAAFADAITQAGLEVEAIHPLSSGTNLAIGEVLSCEMHPDSDHLHICQVDLKDQVEQIVCGAPNVAKGQKVIVAKVGAKLPGGEIKAGSIRGVASNGMICSLAELGVDPHLLSEESKNGIEVLSADAPIGHTDPLAYLGLNDTVFDVGLTPNRSDCQSVWAMAVECGAILHKEVMLPRVEGASQKGSSTKLKIASKTAKCPTFLGKVVNHVTIKESPQWMKELLLASGMKSINNVVDISNIVMLETGQPMHFYDIDAIPAQEITVVDGLHTTYTALDGNEYEVLPDDIMITTEAKPIGFGGVMGGDDSKIEATTKGIIIEAASFDHVSIRNTARRLNLNTDASLRYQKGIEPLAVYKAMDRAIALLEQYADASGLEETVVYETKQYEPTVLTVDADSINAMLGTDFTVEEMIEVLADLKLSPIVRDHKIDLCIPSYRSDLKIEADIAEEIIRIIGYDRLPSTLPLLPESEGALSPRQAMRRKIRTQLNQAGLYEARTYTLISDAFLEDAILSAGEAVRLAVPMSEERKSIRTSVLPSLLDAVSYNQNRSAKDVALFEISSVYSTEKEVEHLAIAMEGALQKSRWQNIEIKADFYTLKGLLMNLLQTFGFEGTRISVKENTVDTTHFHPYRSACLYIGKDLFAVFGEIHPAMAKRYDVSRLVMAEANIEVLLANRASKIKYEPISKFPSVVRDLALVVSQAVNAQQLIDIIRKNGKQYVSHVEVFDVYTGEHVAKGYKSIALSITFGSHEKTLTDEEISAVNAKIMDALQKETNAQLRA